jgi:hypothetical protein
VRSSRWLQPSGDRGFATLAAEQLVNDDVAVGDIATGPFWTDWVVAITAIVGTAGLFIGLGLSVRQLTLQTRQLELQTKQDQKALDIRTGQRAFDLMRLLIEVGRPAIEYPELGPYLHQGIALPLDNEDLRNRVLAYASGYMSLAEIVGWQVRTGQLQEDSKLDWQRYFTALHDRSDALQTVVKRDRGMLAAETRRLLGINGLTKLPAEPPRHRSAENRLT